MSLPMRSPASARRRLRLPIGNPYPLLVAVLTAGIALGDAGATSYAEHRDAMAFADDIAQRHGLSAPSVRALIGAGQRRDDILKLMRRPAEGKPWHAYRAIFLTDRRIREGMRFQHDHRDSLQRMAREVGVDPHIVTAIIGVETYYGGNMGAHRVLDALTTLAFDYPKRARFFSKELEQFVLLTHRQDIDARTVKGSYAGAMGLGQFMPSSYRAYARDGDGDGRIDLWGSVDDAIFSVAHYLKRHGWRTDERIVAAVSAIGDAQPDKRLKPTRTLRALSSAGLLTPAKLPPDAKATLIELQSEHGATHWLGLHNFYVITRYNHSHKYAMAVTQLSQAIRQRLAMAHAPAARPDGQPLTESDA